MANVPQQPEFARHKYTKKELEEQERLRYGRSFSGQAKYVADVAHDFGIGAANSIPALTNVAGDMVGIDTPTMDTISSYLRSKQKVKDSVAINVGEFTGVGFGNLATSVAKRVPTAFSRYSKLLDDDIVNRDSIQTGWNKFKDLATPDPERIARHRKSVAAHKAFYAANHNPDAGLIGWLARNGF